MMWSVTGWFTLAKQVKHADVQYSRQLLEDIFVPDIIHLLVQLKEHTFDIMQDSLESMTNNCLSLRAEPEDMGGYCKPYIPD